MVDSNLQRDNVQRDREYVRETRVENGRGGGSSALAFIVGGLLVAVAVLAFLFWDDLGFGTTATAPVGDVNVTVDNDAPAPAADAEAPAPAPAEGN
jgi:hypothetical protein